MRKTAQRLARIAAVVASVAVIYPVPAPTSSSATMKSTHHHRGGR